MTGKIALELGDVVPRRVVEAAIATMQPAAQAKEVTLTPALGEVTAMIRGDGARLQQIVCNLLSNAIKFTAPGGRVDVELAMSGDQVQISVVDTGQGIKPEFLPHVFERFSGWGSRSSAIWWTCIPEQSRLKAMARAAARAS